ncbi:MAG: hypothetical protein P1S60_17490 [Anaerolineae bacterium]|nr:hypothetical protein [Anaerolineae bacterium]
MQTIITVVVAWIVVLVISLISGVVLGVMGLSAASVIGRFRKIPSIQLIEYQQYL